MSKPIETAFPVDQTELFMENVRVPATHMIGEEGRGFEYMKLIIARTL